MVIGKSPLQTDVESANTSSTREQILQALQTGPEYRHAFMQECIASRLTAQMKAIRSDMDYKQFAQRINKKPSWVYRLEDPNAPPPTIPTLLVVAEAFDIALDVRFCPYSQLVDDVSTLKERSFSVPSFCEERDAGGAHPDGEWSHLTLEFQKDGHARFHKFTADALSNSIRLAERERCAKIAERELGALTNSGAHPSIAWDRACHEIAHRIREGK